MPYSNFSNQLHRVKDVDVVGDDITITFYNGKSINCVSGEFIRGVLPKEGELCQFNEDGDFLIHPPHWRNETRHIEGDAFQEYRSTKIVKACKFGWLPLEGDKRTIALTDGTVLEPTDQFFDRFGDLLNPNNYIVEYEGGYLSVSPPGAFEAGNVPNTSMERLLAQITDILRDKLSGIDPESVNVGAVINNGDGTGATLEFNLDAETLESGNLTQWSMGGIDIDANAEEIWGAMSQVYSGMGEFVSTHSEGMEKMRIVTEMHMGSGSIQRQTFELSHDQLTSNEHISAESNPDVVDLITDLAVDPMSLVGALGTIEEPTEEERLSKLKDAIAYYIGPNADKDSVNAIAEGIVDKRSIERAVTAVRNELTSPAEGIPVNATAIPAFGGRSVVDMAFLVHELGANSDTHFAMSYDVGDDTIVESGKLDPDEILGTPIAINDGANFNDVRLAYYKGDTLRSCKIAFSAGECKSKTPELSETEKEALMHGAVNPSPIELYVQTTESKVDHGAYIVNLYPELCGEFGIQLGDTIQLTMNGQLTPIELSSEADFGTCFLESSDVFNERPERTLEFNLHGTPMQRNVVLHPLVNPESPSRYTLEATASKNEGMVHVAISEIMSDLYVDPEQQFKYTYTNSEGNEVTHNYPELHSDTWFSADDITLDHVLKFEYTDIRTGDKRTHEVNVSFVDKRMSTRPTSPLSGIDDGLMDALLVDADGDEPTFTAESRSTSTQDGKYIIRNDGGALRSNSPTSN